LTYQSQGLLEKLPITQAHPGVRAACKQRHPHAAPKASIAKNLESYAAHLQILFDGYHYMNTQNIISGIAKS
jgi:hypothetical protein